VTIQTAEEALKSHRAKMGDQIGETYHYCLNEVCDLSITWDQHETLFQNKERVEILNRTSGLLAHSIQRHFFNAVVMGLSRLTDLPVVSGKDTLTIFRLSSLCSNIGELKLTDLTVELEDRMKDLRNARHKILAHNDYKVMTKKVRSLTMGTRQNITAIFRIIFRLLGRILQHFEQSQLGMFPQGNDSAWSLIYNLHFGIKFIAETEKRVQEGSWLEMKKVESPSWLKLSNSETDRYKIEWE
jgi:hypothetical protein